MMKFSGVVAVALVLAGCASNQVAEKPAVTEKKAEPVAAKKVEPAAVKKAEPVTPGISAPKVLEFEPIAEAQIYKFTVGAEGVYDISFSETPKFDIASSWDKLPLGEFRVRMDGMIACGNSVGHDRKVFRKVAAGEETPVAAEAPKSDKPAKPRRPDNTKRGWDIRPWHLTNKIPAGQIFYRVGDKVQTVIEVKDENGAYVNDPDMEIRVSLYKSHENEKLSFPLNGKPVVLDLTMDHPGCALSHAQVGFAANKYWGVGRWKISPDGAHTNTVYLEQGAGAVFDVEKIRPGRPLPKRPAGLAKTRKEELGSAFNPTNDVPYVEDVDEFWDKLLAEDARGDWKVKKCELKSKPDAGIRLYHVVLDSLGGEVQCQMSIPADADKGKKYPIWAMFQGYGVAPNFTYPWDWAITIAVTAHPYDIYGGNAYWKQKYAETYFYGFNPDERGTKKVDLPNNNNLDPAQCYFKDMLLRGVRAIRYMMTRPEWDGKTVFTYGGSQGGFQAAALGSLVREVTDVQASCPWITDMGGSKSHTFRPKYRYAFAFTDPANLIHRTHARTFTIHQGLKDSCCPPDGAAALMNNAPASTKVMLRYYQNQPHAVPDQLVGEYATAWRENGVVTKTEWEYSPKAKQ